MATFTFDHTGSAQTQVAPTTGLYIIALWGGGGGAGYYASGSTCLSGAGAGMEIAVNVNAGDVIKVEVGQGGKPGTNSPAAGGLGGWPDGGMGVLGDVRCGGGGGSTRVYINDVLVAVAGAGGGASGYQGGGSAGAGGYPKGQDAEGSGGTGGTQTAGGVDSNAPTVVIKQGASFQGGRGGNVANNTTSTSDDGGGGGGGYYGGAGGGGDGQSGGGGSSWVHPSLVQAVSHFKSDRDVAGGAVSSPYYKAGVAIGRNKNTLLPGGDGYVVIDSTPPVSPVMVSRAAGFAVLKNKRIELSRTAAFAVLATKQLDVSHTATFVVLVEGPPDPYDLELRVSQVTGFAVMQPGDNGPISYITSSAADAIFTANNNPLRVSGRRAEAVLSVDAQARVASLGVEGLTNNSSNARFTDLALEVLRSTAEITVQAFVSTQYADIAYDNFGNARTAAVYAEVLIASDLDGEGFGSVALMN